MKLAEVRVVEAARGEGRRVNRGRRPPSTLRAHSRAVPRLECTALGAGKVGWERTPPRRLCGLRWLPRQTVLRAQRQNEFEEPVGMDSRVPPLGTAASGGTWPVEGVERFTQSARTQLHSGSDRRAGRNHRGEVFAQRLVCARAREKAKDAK